MDVLTVNFDQSLNYLSAEYFKTSVEKKVITEYLNLEYVFINGMSINYTIDVTVVKVSRKHFIIALPSLKIHFYCKFRILLP